MLKNLLIAFVAGIICECIDFISLSMIQMSYEDILHVLHTAVFRPQKLSLRHACFLTRSAVMLLYLLAVVVLRFSLVGGNPHFSK